MGFTAGSRLGPYEVVGPLGAGGMGVLYRARDARLNRDVALKVLPESFTHDPVRVARFRREAQVLASLNHPNIGGIHGLEEADGTTALVLELVLGPTLAERIARGPLPLDEALRLAGQIALAPEAAHERGIVHRDLKPANVKLRPDGTLTVLDFGLAKSLDADAASPAESQSPTLTSPAITRGGTTLGTAAYMSPEQARGQPVDERTDVWAFGCVLFEMLTGTLTFEGANVSDMVASVLRAEPRWSELPAEAAPVVPVLRRCLEKDAARRFRSAGDVRLLLEDAAKSGPAVAGASPRRSWSVPIAAAVGLLLLAPAAPADVSGPQHVRGLVSRRAKARLPVTGRVHEAAAVAARGRKLDRASADLRRRASRPAARMVARCDASAGSEHAAEKDHAAEPWRSQDQPVAADALQRGGRPLLARRPLLGLRREPDGHVGGLGTPVPRPRPARARVLGGRPQADGGRATAARSSTRTATG